MQPHGFTYKPAFVRPKKQPRRRPKKFSVARLIRFAWLWLIGRLRY